MGKKGTPHRRFSKEEKLRIVKMHLDEHKSIMQIERETSIKNSLVSAAEWYHSTDIFVDELPDTNTVEEMLNTFRKAGIESIVIADILQERFHELEGLGCQIIGECKVFRRETELYIGPLEVIKGFRLKILTVKSNR